MESQLTAHLNWNRPLKRVRGRSLLLHEIDVFVDFEWEERIGHPQRTFTNYMSLGDYVRKGKRADRHAALLLTDQSGSQEGCKIDHETHDIFIVNIVRYKNVKKGDAAGAYFAGLQGAPIIDPTGLNEEAQADLLDAIGSVASIALWIERHPDDLSSLVSKMGNISLRDVNIAILMKEFTRRIKESAPDDLQPITTLLSSPDFPLAALRTAGLAHRISAAAEFKRELERDEWSEKEWQRFFKQEQWIFGHGLLYQFVTPVEDEANVGGSDIANRGGRLADYAVRTRSHSASFIALVEIKVPSTNLVGPAYRNRTYGMHGELSGAVSQLIGNCDQWNHGGSRQEENVRRAAIEKYDTVQPRGILVVGHMKSLDDRDKKISFELFRRHLHGIEILTFDELLVRAENLTAPEQPE